MKNKISLENYYYKLLTKIITENNGTTFCMIIKQKIFIYNSINNIINQRSPKFFTD